MRYWALVLLAAGAGVACGPPRQPEPAAPPASAVPSTASDVPSARAASSVSPYETSECEVLSHNYGAWQPTVGQIANAGERLATGLCYNYWEIDPRKLAATVHECAAKSRSAMVRLVVPLATTSGSGACDIELRSISWNGRSWFWVRSSYQRNAQFGYQIDVVELRGDELAIYGTAMVCEGDREHAMQSNSPPVESGDVSPAMASDWHAFPPDLRAFFCTAELIGPDLSKGE